MNWFRSFLGFTRHHHAIRPQTRSVRRSRPDLECLETRCLLATGITEFAPLPTAGSQPDAVTTGPDGNIWFTEVNRGNRIGRIAPDGTLLGETTLADNSQPAAITVGPDGNLWFTEQNANKIGRVNTAGTLLGETVIPTANSQPVGITAGPDGNLWFVESSGNKIGRIATDGTILSETFIPTTNSQPVGIAAGPDGNLWFTEFASTANKIGRITPAGVITEFPVPTAASNPFNIIAGPDGNLWFTEPNGEKIGRITVSGVVTEFPIPTANGQPNSITTGPDGNLWFTEIGSGRIGEITPAGFVAAEFIVPTANSAPAGITIGPHSSVVFTEFGQAASRLAMLHDILDANHSFVQSLYQDVLGRLGSPAELDGWVSTIVSSGIGPVVSAFEHSTEGRTHLLNNWYLHILGRATPPSASEIQGWLNAFQAGATEEQVLAAFLSSPEFFNYATTRLISTGTANERFVSALYLLLLNRSASTGEIQGWVAALPTLGQAGLANIFLGSAEYRSDIVRSYYTTLLHRSTPPSAAEVGGWVATGLDANRLRISFESSLEFFLRG